MSMFAAGFVIGAAPFLIAGLALYLTPPESGEEEMLVRFREMEGQGW